MITYSVVSIGEWLMKDRPLVLIGGSFNPFTNAHKAMALAVREKIPDSTIVYVPGDLGYLSRWKTLPKEDTFSGKNRIEIIKKCVKDIKNCFVSEYEAAGPGSGRTYDTVKYLSFFGEGEVCVCIGSDKLSEIEKWYRADDLINMTKFIVLTRGSSIDDCKSYFIQSHRDRFIEIPFDYPEVSSTRVRELYKEGNFDEIAKLVPEPVYNYLKDAYAKSFVHRKEN